MKYSSVDSSLQLRMPKHIRKLPSSFHLDWARVLMRENFEKNRWQEELDIAFFYDSDSFRACFLSKIGCLPMFIRPVLIKVWTFIEKLKQKIIDASETDTTVIQRSIGSSTRVLRNPWAEKILEMEAKGSTLEELMPYISGQRGGKAWLSGDEDAAFACGQVIGRINENLSVKDLVAKIASEAEETYESISKFRTS